ncbi:hypothetical protein [Prochlorococcus sp. MIT 1307]|uniref:hypothetical protein n=1 Tax=Prochlorococcus sp. MIT 1307 TaxID=3096219 RepID=UPI002A749AA6|nr:hypothetical protein [Prochlorococcus sp. MIT 1307]
MGFEVKASSQELRNINISAMHGLIDSQNCLQYQPIPSDLEKHTFKSSESGLSVQL